MVFKDAKPNIAHNFFAKLEKEVVIIGVLNKIEIWSKDKWLEYSKEENNE